MFMFELASSFWFLYLGIPLFFIFLLFTVENEHATFGTVVFVATLLGLQLFTDVHPFSYILANPINSLYAFGLYFILGVVYVYLKWYSYVRQTVDKFNEWRKLNPDRPVDYFRPSIPLKVSDYKSRIFYWLTYWPLSAVWTLLNDPIRRLVNAIYNSIAGTLQKISDNAFAGIK